MSTVPNLVASRELFSNLVQRELRSKFKTTALGWLWSLANPIAQVVIFTIVVKFIFKVEPAQGAGGLNSFPVWVLCGIITWNYFTTAATMSMISLTGNANLVQKAAFPRALLIGAVTAAQGVTSLIEFGVLLVLLLILGVVPFLWIPLVLVALVALVCFTTGVGLLLSIANVYFRDTAHLMGIVFQLWFYATPVIYPYEHLTQVVDNEWLLAAYQANPMVHVVNIVRDALYYHRLPSLGSVAYVYAAALGVLALGYAVFRRFEPRLAEEM
ncbi:MAG TPA: ABC transporter permease [Intrasporangium sp.]|uniref:ABC transporter permease n=1 Tax=Intrasporangium sp. TaxID=1925024 RepID=UPI002D777F77|nr:ABC transporter permease [Intrasporangium sp.]HET7399936.1 ABC transporter permease [Intrasporangium sp.]